MDKVEIKTSFIFIPILFSQKIGTTLQHVFIGRKLEQDLKPREIKPPIINQQRVVYSLTCDLCNSDDVSFTA